jgi:hypothetical protein
MPERIDLQQGALNDFVRSVNLRLASKDLPEYIRKDPLIVGQCVHEVVRGTAVYLMICEERGSSVTYIKVGLARNIAKRMGALTSSCPLPIRRALYFCTAGYRHAWALEQALHEKFSDLRIGGEWFKIDRPEDRAGIVASMVDFAEERLGDNFNSFVFDPKKANDPSMRKVCSFVETVWELTGEMSFTKDLEAAMTSLSASSARHYENIQFTMSKSWGMRLK